jgi:dsRNA-specific ribonuclease
MHWFGAATIEDAKLLEENLLTLQIATEAGFQKFASTVDKFSSFVNLTTDHSQNLGAALFRQVTNAHRYQRQMNAAITFLLKLILSHSEYVDASSLILQFQTQLQHLIAGQLPRDFITPEMLEDVTRNI